MRNANSCSVQVGPATVYYEVYGEGPAVLFAPGGEEIPLHFFQNIPAFVNAGFTVLVMSLRGHFMSTCPPADCHPQHFETDIEAILDQEGIERAALIGESLGGFGTMRFAARRPDRTACQVLMGSSAAVWSEQNYGATSQAVETFLGRLKSGDPRRAPADPMALLDRNLTLLTSEDGLIAIPVNIVLHMLDESLWLKPAELEGYDIPTLIIGGDEDDFLGRGFQRHLVDLIPGARLGELMATGHRPYWSHPQAFNDEAIRFLKKSGRWTASEEAFVNRQGMSS